MSVEDLLAVSLSSATDGGIRVIDSGGELVEMGELARAVVAVVNPSASIERAPLSAAPSNDYFASTEAWDSACAAASFTPAPLADQIATAANGVLATG